jgi:hypothetical protein
MTEETPIEGKISARRYPEGVGPDAWVTVRMSAELMQLLSKDWSAPVQIMVRESGESTHTHEMITRTHECGSRAPLWALRDRIDE